MKKHIHTSVQHILIRIPHFFKKRIINLRYAEMGVSQ